MAPPDYGIIHAQQDYGERRNSIVHEGSLYHQVVTVQGRVKSCTNDQHPLCLARVEQQPCVAQPVHEQDTGKDDDEYGKKHGT